MVFRLTRLLLSYKNITYFMFSKKKKNELISILISDESLGSIIETVSRRFHFCFSSIPFGADQNRRHTWNCSIFLQGLFQTSLVIKYDLSFHTSPPSSLHFRRWVQLDMLIKVDILNANQCQGAE